MCVVNENGKKDKKIHLAKNQFSVNVRWRTVLDGMRSVLLMVLK